MAIRPKGIRREGAQILYGNILLATIYESGAVVCAIIPKVIIQRIENTLQIVATRVNKSVGLQKIGRHRA